jgi:hypothetical protein
MHNLNKNEAKVLWAGVILERLISSRDPLSIKELFLPKEDSDLTIPIMRKMAMSKDWQRKLLNRLIDEGLVAKTGSARGTAYEINDKQKAVQLLTRAQDDVIYIKNLIWPAEYPLPEQVEHEEPLVARGVGSDVTHLVQEEEEENALVKALTAIIKQNTAIYQRMDILEEQQKEILSRTDAIAKLWGELQPGLGLLLTSIDGKIETLNQNQLELFEEHGKTITSIQTTIDPIPRLLSSLNKKLDDEKQKKLIEILAKVMEFSSQGKRLINQVSTQSKKEDSLFKEIEDCMKELKQTNEQRSG